MLLASGEIQWGVMDEGSALRSVCECVCVCVCGENTQDLLSAAFPISTSLQSLGISIPASASMS